MSKPTLLITGATGNQGSATINALLDRKASFHLRALVRDLAAPKALALAERGVELVRGSFDDADSVRSALGDVYGVLSVQTPMGHGPEGEERHGKLLATLAVDAGVSHFIQCSAAGVDRDSGVPHFESKQRIERHIEALGLRSTILRPAAFTENFESFAFRTIMLSMMKTYLRDDQPMQLASAKDVGWFAAEAFEKPAEYIGKAIEIAGDSVTRHQAAAALRRAGRRPVLMFNLPSFVLAKLPEDFRLMFEWIARDGFHADIPALRKVHPNLMSLPAWAGTAS